MPTLFVASAIILPIALSPLAKIVPTWAIVGGLRLPGVAYDVF
jgi:hypothetical protein